MIHNYQNLLVWQKSMTLVYEVYRLVKGFPKEELYALSSQMRRSAVSIPSNIAEGQQRKSSKEFVNFLSIARGSNAELQTQLLLSVGLGFLTEEDIENSMNLSVEIGKMLSVLIKRIDAN